MYDKMPLIVFGPLILFFTNIHAYVNVVDLNQNKFPDNFLFGVATSAYQVEAAWNKNDGANGDIAANSYHEYKADVQLLKELGVNFYKFSLSWSRILPTGHSNDINEDGIRYYNHLIGELLKEGVTPMVTIFHADLPQPLQDLGGWASPLMVDYFVEFARVVFDSFSDHVPYWITINEPYANCLRSSDRQRGVADYLCVHHQLIAHARAYRLWKTEYQGQGKTPRNAMMSLSIDAVWYVPKRADDKDDKMAAAVQAEFHLGITANPIFGSGDYPKMVKDLVRQRSVEEGYPQSRLPEFSPEEVSLLNGSADFFALNYFTHYYVQHTVHSISTNSSMEMDAQITTTFPTEDPPYLEKSPWSFRKMLKHINKQYNNPLLIITGNGYADKGELKDCRRVQYLQEYLSALLEAVYEDNCNVSGYAVWSLLDNFQWRDGFSQRYGLYHVDITTLDRKRTAKESAREYARIIKQGKLSEKSMDVATCAAESYLINSALLTSAIALIALKIKYE